MRRSSLLFMALLLLMGLDLLAGNGLGMADSVIFWNSRH